MPSIAMHTAAAGMTAAQKLLEVTTGNITRQGVNGDKRQHALFDDTLYQNLQTAGAASSDSGTVTPVGSQIGLGVRLSGTATILEQGPLNTTGNTYDVAVQGNGYLQVELPSGGTAYTRDGALSISPEGTIVTKQGYTVIPATTIPAGAVSVTINESGTVIAEIQGQDAPQEVGQLELAIFPNAAGLKREGGNLLSKTASSGDAIIGAPGSEGFGTLLQGFLESSNVNPITEVANLIEASRSFELISKALKSSEEMERIVTQV